MKFGVLIKRRFLKCFDEPVMCYQKRMDEIVDGIVKLLIAECPLGIGVINLHDVELYLGNCYEKLARYFYKKYGKKLDVEMFAESINSRLKKESRIKLSSDIVMCVKGENHYKYEKIKCYTEYRINIPWYKEIECIRFSHENDVEIYFNSGVIIDSNYIRKYIRHYFNSKIKKAFLRKIKKEREYFETIREIRYVISLNYEEEIKALKFWANTSDDTIIKHISSIAKSEALNMEINKDDDGCIRLIFSVK